MKAFEFLVLLHPSKKEKEDEKTTQIIVPTTMILAEDFEHAKLLAGRAIPETYLEKLNRVEVAVRPF